MKKLLTSLLFLSLLSHPVYAGSNYVGVNTTGAVTLGHCVSFVNSNTIQDAGAACGGAGATPGGAAGTIQYNNAGAFGGFTMSQDCTISTATGVITCTKTNNVAFTSAATTAIGTTGAVIPLANSNITFGGTDTFSNAPTITPFSTAGIVFNSAAGLLSTGTTISLTTQASGTLQAAQAPALTSDVTSSAGSLATTVAKIQGTTVTGTTGSGAVVFGTSPTINGKSIANPPITSIVRQVFTASGTYTPTTGMVYADIEGCGAGGGGGGVSAGAQFTSAGGGGAGAYAKGRFNAATVGANQTITIGAAGGGGTTSGTNGSAGGTTTIGTLITNLNGGTGGAGATGTGGNAGGGGGAVGTGGDYKIAGQAGGNSFSSSSGAFALSGTGGDSMLGTGGVDIFNGGGATGQGYCSGGSGAASTTTTAAAGGSGAPGIVIVLEYVSN